MIFEYISRYSVATGRTAGVWFPAGARVLSLLRRLQTDSGAHPASNEVGPGGKG